MVDLVLRKTIRKKKPIDKVYIYGPLNETYGVSSVMHISFKEMSVYIPQQL
jgi:hypothetical protein